MIFKKNKQVAVEAKSVEPFATITGVGIWGYRVVVSREWESPTYYGYDTRSYTYYNRTFWFSKKRAERYAKTRLDRAKHKYDHAHYSKTITLD